MPLGVALAGLASWACASGAGSGNALEPPAAAAPAGVRVRLVFGADADLDLYVTGPSREAVYFANDRSREGGALESDRRCDAAEPRVETIEFPGAPPGAYRVGVDFMVRCAPGVDHAPYLLILEAPGREPRRRRGDARFGSFDPRAAEFRVGP